MLKQIPRQEYPRPQMVRKEWMNLNGEWDFEFDYGKSGEARKMNEGEGFSKKITVPFCPESELSGIGNKDFMECVWYKRSVALPADWKGKRVLIHIGAADYITNVYVNGMNCGSHMGGYTSFCFDITDKLKDGENLIVIRCLDEQRRGNQPVGKQCNGYFSAGCSYTRTTGIWQTVWLEAVSESYIKHTKFYPDIETPSLAIDFTFGGNALGMRVKATAFYEGRECGEDSAVVQSFGAKLMIKLSEKHLWEVGNGRLYDLKLTLEDEGGKVIDSVDSYFGLRTTAIDGKALLINGKKVFQRLVLDQGFYPDGIYTAPNDEALKKDIEISMGLGFNGARLHEKVFEQRFIYWADKLGYLVWGELADWGQKWNEEALRNFLPQWMESIERDFNSPAIIGWCPHNETNFMQIREHLKITVDVTKAYDNTRPVIDTSGFCHVDEITDIYDVHNYEQDPEKFAKLFEGLGENKDVFVNNRRYEHYNGKMPYFVSEYGGIGWSLNDNAWGYGNAPKTEEEFIERYKGLTNVLLDNPHICAFCYTQLYDVEQEMNGLYTYDRKPKFEPSVFKAINSKKAAIED